MHTYRIIESLLAAVSSRTIPMISQLTGMSVEIHVP